MNPVATIKARRLTGGAVITVTRADGRSRQYRVGLRRYNRLADILAVTKGTSGWADRHGYSVDLRSLAGLAESRRYMERHYGGARKPKHWRAS